MTPSAHRAFLLVGLIFGVLFVFVVPPFHVPDEPQHFYRAFQVSELGLARAVTLTDVKHRTPHPGALLPRSLATVVEAGEVPAVRFRLDAKVSPARIIAALRVPLDRADREYLPLAFYPPVAYLPQALGIGVGRLLGLPPLALFYLGRLGAVAAFLGLVTLAIRTTPVLRWPLFLLALMPMTVHLAASCSSDGIVIALAFLLVATLLDWAYGERPGPIGAGDVWLLLAIVLALALAKPPYLVLLALAFLVPPRRFGGLRAYGLTLLAAFAVALGSILAWAWLTRPVLTTGPVVDLARHGVDFWAPTATPREQLAFVLSRPGAFADVLVATLRTFGRGYVVTFVGALGWLDTRLPVWLPYAYVLVLTATALVDGSAARIGWAARGLGLAVAALGSLGLLVVIYMTINAVGALTVEGLQGRYLIPLAPPFFLAFHVSRPRWRVTRPLALTLVAVAVVTMTVATSRVVERFYVAGLPSYSTR